MALKKREDTWHTDFSVHGQRYRQSLRTTDWREAQAREKELITQASQGKLAPSSQQFARLAFSEAADRYLDSRKLELSESSQKKERQLLAQPRRYFEATPLTRITAESLLAYREWRVEGGVGPAIVNMEMGAIRRILKRAKRWHLIAGDIRPLKEPRGVGRALSPDEKLRLLRVAASRPEWQIARLAMRLALNTTMRACEIRALQWKDINLLEQTVTIQRSKTDAGERVIPLNADALRAILELRERAKLLFGVEPKPTWYVFPHAEGFRKPDPTKPMSSWRTAWRRLTRAVSCPSCGLLQQPTDICRNRECKADMHGLKSPLAGLRFHDLRHHAITELAESEASEQTIMSIAGHVSPRMLAHYSHVRLEAKRRAVEVLSSRLPSSETARPAGMENQAAGGGLEGGYGTKNVTNEAVEGLPGPEVIEKVVGAGGLEPPTSTVSR